MMLVKVEGVWVNPELITSVVPSDGSASPGAQVNFLNARNLWVPISADDVAQTIADAQKPPTTSWGKP